jgi:hypothetical protein
MFFNIAIVWRRNPRAKQKHRDIRPRTIQQPGTAREIKVGHDRPLFGV